MRKLLSGERHAELREYGFGTTGHGHLLSTLLIIRSYPACFSIVPCRPTPLQGTRFFSEVTSFWSQRSETARRRRPCSRTSELARRPGRPSAIEHRGASGRVDADYWTPASCLGCLSVCRDSRTEQTASQSASQVKAASCLHALSGRRELNFCRSGFHTPHHRTNCSTSFEELTTAPSDCRWCV